MRPSPEVPSSLSNSVINDELQAQSLWVQGKPMRADQSCGLCKSSSALAPDCSSQTQSSWHILCMKSSPFLSNNEIEQYPKGYSSTIPDHVTSSTSKAHLLPVHIYTKVVGLSAQTQIPGVSETKQCIFSWFFFFPLQATCNQYVNMLTSNCIISAIWHCILLMLVFPGYSVEIQSY